MSNRDACPSELAHMLSVLFVSLLSLQIVQHSANVCLLCYSSEEGMLHIINSDNKYSNGWRLRLRLEQHWGRYWRWQIANENLRIETSLGRRCGWTSLVLQTGNLNIQIISSLIDAQMENKHFSFFFILTKIIIAGILNVGVFN